MPTAIQQPCINCGKTFLYPSCLISGYRFNLSNRAIKKTPISFEPVTCGFLKIHKKISKLKTNSSKLWFCPECRAESGRRWKQVRSLFLNHH